MRALVIGATGAVGSEVIKGLLNIEGWKFVRVLARQKASIAHPKLQWHVGDLFSDEFISTHLEDITHIFMCIGTTRKKTPDRETYRTIDYGIPVRTAQLAANTDVYHMLVVSAIGSNPKSWIFYSKLKGEMERDVASTALPRVDFFRPSTIIGQRPERRPAEEWAIKIDRWLGGLIPNTYRAVRAEQIARAMIDRAKLTEEGRYYVENAEILKY
ncbi:hypothetical protein JCM31826_05500 [Thermaurantimonas aggregans]|uniref:NAD(P)-binding domain-containing protein n=1 Tax=Thermaurantimonas aggregans TaxID=2173829 RepID=A0A401XJA3_9FLAO|nr:NAD(P)H-binding protein [Thermaurantimonas aggregans]MCX8149670.1 NAD(P)H-binding protein [Thermaurantimonas aggregans]GCD77068.1 hypothetical protein JCM31826_05500 [Thermaurantimonas aggregans]